MSSPIRPPLTVKTIDGTTEGRPINTIRVTNGDLSISGTVATIDTSGGGGGTGTVTSVGTSQAFITITDPTTTPSISIGNASGAATGVLTAASFNTFDAKQDAITLTTTGTSGAATFAGGTLNIPQYTDSGGTVTSVGTSQAFITIANPTTTPSISIGNASGAATGVLTASDWTDFDGKQDAITLTTTGSSGAATLVGSTLNIPQYTGGGGGGIGGSITDNQVAVGATTADEIEGYSDFTYNDSLNTLTVGEKIESSGTSQLQLIAGSSNISILDSGVANHINITPASGRLNTVASTLSVGTNSADATVSSRGAYNLTLNTNDGTNSGSIVITDGVDGQISITPNGAGKIKLDGVDLDNSAIATGYVLKATSANAAGWAAESGGGGSPGGSSSQIQYNDGGAFGGSSVMTFDDTATAEQVLFSGTSSQAIFKVEQLGAGNSIEVHDAATDTTIFLVDQFGRAAIKTNTISAGYDLTVGGSSFIQGHIKLSTGGTTANPAIKWDADTTTGINKPTNGEIAIVSAGTETFRFGADGDFEIVGDAGTAGQVFTSGGASAAASWTTPSGGGGGGSMLYGSPNGDWQTSYLEFQNIASNGWATSQATTTTDLSSGRQFFRPFVSSMSGDLTAMSLNVSTSSVGSTIRVGIYNADSSDGNPTSLIGYAEFDSTSTGTKTRTSFSTAITLERDKLYYYAVVATSGSPSVRSMNATYSNALYLANGYAAQSWSLVDYTNTNALSDPASTSTIRGGNGSYAPINVGLKWI